MRIYTTEKEIREYQKDLIKNKQPLQKAITLDELKSRVIIADRKIFADDDTRLALLEESLEFEEFGKLNIPKNFDSFIENGKFILGFLQECACEYVDIRTLYADDAYAQYKSHLLVLEQIRQRYISLSDKSGYACPISINGQYEINVDYLNSIVEEGIDFFYGGYLSRFEIDMIAKIAEVTPFKLHYKATKNSKKMNDRFKEIFETKIAPGQEYTFNFSTKQIEAQSPIGEYGNMAIQACTNSFAQAGYVKYKINEFVRKGIDPSDIVVIVQNESINEILKAVDDFRNLNFSGGETFKKTKTYKKLYAALALALDKSTENTERFDRYAKKDEELQKMYKTIVTNWSSNETAILLQLLKDFLDEGETKEAQIAYKKALAKTRTYLKLFPNTTTGKVMLSFLRRLADVRLSDATGGRITVMQPLEARQVNAKAYIFVDFNEGKVPVDSVKDLFMTSSIRAHANIPTFEDREALQKYFYEIMFLRAQEIAVSYIQNDIETKSRFIEEFDYSKDTFNSNALIELVLPANQEKEEKEEEDIELDIDLTKEAWSASKLKIYLDCKRKFYFKYVKKVKEPQEQHNEAARIGVKVHAALKELYAHKPHPIFAGKIYRELIKNLRSQMDNSAYMKLQAKVWEKKFSDFARKEAIRFSKGIRVSSTEEYVKKEYRGLMLEGYIDRIDYNSNTDTYEIIDYKSGRINTYTDKTYANATDFQLEFYRILAKNEKRKNIQGAYFYDLNEVELVDEIFHEGKMEILPKRLEEISQKRQNFIKCKKDHCNFCAYKELCKKS